MTGAELPRARRGAHTARVLLRACHTAVFFRSPASHLELPASAPTTAARPARRLRRPPAARAFAASGRAVAPSAALHVPRPPGRASPPTHSNTPASDLASACPTHPHDHARARARTRALCPLTPTPLSPPRCAGRRPRGPAPRACGFHRAPPAWPPRPLSPDEFSKACTESISTESASIREFRPGAPPRANRVAAALRCQQTTERISAARIARFRVLEYMVTQND